MIECSMDLVRLFSICFFLTLFNQGFSQEFLKIKLKIKIRPVEHYKHRLKKCDIIFYKDFNKVDSINLKSNKLKKNITSKGFYKIVFKKDNYVEKHIVINAANLPENKRQKYKLKAQITLFHKSESEEVSFLETEPISIAYYNETSSDLIWDFEYNRSMIEKIIHAQTKNK